MGLFDFMKKNETKNVSDKKTADVNPASLETYTVKVENDQIPFHDIGVRPAILPLQGAGRRSVKR